MAQGYAGMLKFPVALVPKPGAGYVHPGGKR